MLFCITWILHWTFRCPKSLGPKNMCQKILVSRLNDKEPTIDALHFCKMFQVSTNCQSRTPKDMQSTTLRYIKPLYLSKLFVACESSFQTACKTQNRTPRTRAFQNTKLTNQVCSTHSSKTQAVPLSIFTHRLCSGQSKFIGVLIHVSHPGQVSSP